MPSPSLAGFAVLHQFDGGAADGAEPRGLIVAGNHVYGTTVHGGNSDFGTVYKINTDGTGHAIMHKFAGSDGRSPMSAPLLVGSTLYGTTLEGGANGDGMIYRLNADGTGFATVHNFNRDLASDQGRGPQTTPVISGGVVFGTTRFGGPTDRGTVYRMNLDGSAFTRLRAFTGGADGGAPKQPVIDGTTMVAASSKGQFGDTLFKLNTDGSGYQLLRDFATGGSEGSLFSTSPVLIGSVLYGTTVFGGANNTGVIYRMNTDGTGFEVLHDFADLSSYTWGAHAQLLVDGSTLYGITDEGGSAGTGTLFQIQTDGSGFQILHEFSGVEGHGESNLVLVDSTLYGTRRYGGENDMGTLFSFVVPEPGTWSLALSAAVVGLLLFGRRRAGVRQSTLGQS